MNPHWSGPTQQMPHLLTSSNDHRFQPPNSTNSHLCCCDADYASMDKMKETINTNFFPSFLYMQSWELVHISCKGYEGYRDGSHPQQNCLLNCFNFLLLDNLCSHSVSRIIQCVLLPGDAITKGFSVCHHPVARLQPIGSWQLCHQWSILSPQWTTDQLSVY